MYAYLRGELSEINIDNVVVDVGGVGYKVYLSSRNIEKLPHIGSNIKVFTHYYIKEDISDLYGFLTKEEEKIFTLLISINGVGPKAATSILSTLDTEDLIKAIDTNDARVISQAQGIGAKTAQRIILELKDKLGGIPISPISSPGGSHFSDCVDVLVSLGYSVNDASKATRNAEGDNVQEMIKNALALLNVK